MLAGAGAIPAADAAAARKYAEGGGDVPLIGKCLPVAEEGRIGDPVFPE